MMGRPAWVTDITPRIPEGVDPDRPWRTVELPGWGTPCQTCRSATDLGPEWKIVACEFGRKPWRWWRPFGRRWVRTLYYQERPG